MVAVHAGFEHRRSSPEGGVRVGQGGAAAVILSEAKDRLALAPPTRSFASLRMTILRHERAQVVDVSQRHAVLARVAQPPLGPRLAEDRLGLPPPRLVGSAAVRAAAGPRLPALADVHGLRRR